MMKHGHKSSKAIALLGHCYAASVKINEDVCIDGEEEGKVPVSMIWKDIQGVNDWNGMLNPINPALRSELLKYGEMAQATYDAFDDSKFSKYRGSCKYSIPQFFYKVGMPNLGYDVIKYLYATSSMLRSNNLAQQTQWMGYVAISKDEETKRIGNRNIVVAWRGLEDFRDIMLAPRNLQPSKSGVKVHRGILEVYTSINFAEGPGKVSARDQLHIHLQSLLLKYNDEELSITFIGHSLGGALALLSAYDVLLTGKFGHRTLATPVTTFSFGAPRVGNLGFCDSCSQLGLKALRVVNIKDVVPKAPRIFVNKSLHIFSKLLKPWPWTYSHVGPSLVVDTAKSPLIKKNLSDPFSHNKLELYLHLLDGYHGPAMPFQSTNARDPALVNKYADLLINEMGIPSSWKQDLNKGLVQTTKGHWVVPQRPFAWL